MTAWIEDLSDSELYARLTQRGIPAERARQLVARRDDLNPAHIIAHTLHAEEEVA